MLKDFQEAKWLTAARKGDQDSFGELVRLYEKRVFALTLRMCGNPEDAAGQKDLPGDQRVLCGPAAPGGTASGNGVAGR